MHGILAAVTLVLGFVSFGTNTFACADYDAAKDMPEDRLGEFCEKCIIEGTKKKCREGILTDWCFDHDVVVKLTCFYSLIGCTMGSCAGGFAGAGTGAVAGAVCSFTTFSALAASPLCCGTGWEEICFYCSVMRELCARSKGRNPPEICMSRSNENPPKIVYPKYQ